MAATADKFATELRRVRYAAPAPPVVTNVEATPNADASRVADLLRRQVEAPVRFTEMISKLRGLGVKRVLEIGPGRVLTGLVARIDRALERANLASLGDLSGAAAFAIGTGG